MRRQRSKEEQFNALVQSLGFAAIQTMLQKAVRAQEASTVTIGVVPVLVGQASVGSDKARTKGISKDDDREAHDPHEGRADGPFSSAYNGYDEAGHDAQEGPSNGDFPAPPTRGNDDSDYGTSSHDGSGSDSSSDDGSDSASTSSAPDFDEQILRADARMIELKRQKHRQDRTRNIKKDPGFATRRADALARLGNADDLKAVVIGSEKHNVNFRPPQLGKSDVTRASALFCRDIFDDPFYIFVCTDNHAKNIDYASKTIHSGMSLFDATDCIYVGCGSKRKSLGRCQSLSHKKLLEALADKDEGFRYDCFFALNNTATWKTIDTLCNQKDQLGHPLYGREVVLVWDECHQAPWNLELHSDTIDNFIAKAIYTTATADRFKPILKNLRIDPSILPAVHDEDAWKGWDAHLPCTLESLQVQMGMGAKPERPLAKTANAILKNHPAMKKLLIEENAFIINATDTSCKAMNDRAQEYQQLGVNVVTFHYQTPVPRSTSKARAGQSDTVYTTGFQFFAAGRHGSSGTERYPPLPDRFPSPTPTDEETEEAFGGSQSEPESVNENVISEPQFRDCLRNFVVKNEPAFANMESRPPLMLIVKKLASNSLSITQPGLEVSMIFTSMLPNADFTSVIQLFGRANNSEGLTPKTPLGKVLVIGYQDALFAAHRAYADPLMWASDTAGTFYNHVEAVEDRDHVMTLADVKKAREKLRIEGLAPRQTTRTFVPLIDPSADAISTACLGRHGDSRTQKAAVIRLLKEQRDFATSFMGSRNGDTVPAVKRLWLHAAPSTESEEYVVIPKTAICAVLKDENHPYRSMQERSLRSVVIASEKKAKRAITIAMKDPEVQFARFDATGNIIVRAKLPEVYSVDFPVDTGSEDGNESEGGAHEDFEVTTPRKRKHRESKNILDAYKRQRLLQDSQKSLKKVLAQLLAHLVALFKSNNFAATGDLWDSRTDDAMTVSSQKLASLLSPDASFRVNDDPLEGYTPPAEATENPKRFIKKMMTQLKHLAKKRTELEVLVDGVKISVAGGQAEAAESLLRLQ